MSIFHVISPRKRLVDERELEYRGPDCGLDIRALDEHTFKAGPDGALHMYRHEPNLRDHGLTRLDLAESDTPYGMTYKLVPCGDEILVDEEGVPLEDYLQPFEVTFAGQVYTVRRIPFPTDMELACELATMEEEGDPELYELMDQYGTYSLEGLLRVMPHMGRGRIFINRELRFESPDPAIMALSWDELNLLVLTIDLVEADKTPPEGGVALLERLFEGEMLTPEEVVDHIQRRRASLEAVMKLRGDYKDDPVTEDRSLRDYPEPKMPLRFGLPECLVKPSRNPHAWAEFCERGYVILSKSHPLAEGQKDCALPLTRDLINQLSLIETGVRDFIKKTRASDSDVPSYAELQNAIQRQHQLYDAALDTWQEQVDPVSLAASLSDLQDRVAINDDGFFVPEWSQEAMSVRPRPGLGSDVPMADSWLSETDEEYVVQQHARAGLPDDVSVWCGSLHELAHDAPMKRGWSRRPEGHPAAIPLAAFIDSLTAPLDDGQRETEDVWLTGPPLEILQWRRYQGKDVIALNLWEDNEGVERFTPAELLFQAPEREIELKWNIYYVEFPNAQAFEALSEEEKVCFRGMKAQLCDDGKYLGILRRELPEWSRLMVHVGIESRTTSVATETQRYRVRIHHEVDTTYWHPFYRYNKKAGKYLPVDSRDPLHSLYPMWDEEADRVRANIPYPSRAHCAWEQLGATKIPQLVVTQEGISTREVFIGDTFPLLMEACEDLLFAYANGEILEDTLLWEGVNRELHRYQEEQIGKLLVHNRRLWLPKVRELVATMGGYEFDNHTGEFASPWEALTSSFWDVIRNLDEIDEWRFPQIAYVNSREFALAMGYKIGEYRPALTLQGWTQVLKDRLYHRHPSVEGWRAVKTLMSNPGYSRIYSETLTPNGIVPMAGQGLLGDLRQYAINVLSRKKRQPEVLVAIPSLPDMRWGVTPNLLALDDWELALACWQPTEVGCTVLEDHLQLDRQLYAVELHQQFLPDLANKLSWVMMTAGRIPGYIPGPEVVVHDVCWGWSPWFAREYVPSEGEARVVSPGLTREEVRQMGSARVRKNLERALLLTTVSPGQTARMIREFQILASRSREMALDALSELIPVAHEVGEEVMEYLFTMVE